MSSNRIAKKIRYALRFIPDEMYIQLNYFAHFKKFANLKVRNNGEWFKISEELVNFINDINEIKDKYVYLDEESKIWLLDRIELVN